MFYFSEFALVKTQLTLVVRNIGCYSLCNFMCSPSVDKIVQTVLSCTTVLQHSVDELLA